VSTATLWDGEQTGSHTQEERGGGGWRYRGDDVIKELIGVALWDQSAAALHEPCGDRELFLSPLLTPLSSLVSSPLVHLDETLMEETEDEQRVGTSIPQRQTQWT